MRVLTVVLLVALAGCATDPGAGGLGTPAATSASSLSGKTWHLQSVTENGRTWSPLTERPATLTFDSMDTAETDDGANTTQWKAVVEATTIAWTEGISTAVGEPETSEQVETTLRGALDGRTAWSLDGHSLVIKGAHSITLTYGGEQPSAPKNVSGVGVYLNAGSPPKPGEVFHLLSGHVVVRAASHSTVAELDVTPFDDGETQLPPGTYEVSGTVNGRACMPAPAVAAVGSITEVTLGCPAG